MFICFEGMAGIGKSTQARLLVNRFKAANKEILLSLSFEGDRKIAISKFIADIKIENNDIARMFVYQALHSKQFDEANVALKEGKVVIADRWRYSFLSHHLTKGTFQGDESLLHGIDKLTYGGLEPDICFLLDLPVELGYERYVNREKKAGIPQEKLESIDYFSAVKDYYRQTAQAKRWIVVDGQGDPNIVHERVISHLSPV